MKRKLTPLARNLRSRMTDAEIKLWYRLSRKQLGVIFRRQYPIGDFIVDFVSFDSRLIIEVDGSQHADSKQDKNRDEFLESQGFKVLRFWDNEVLNNINGVVETIQEAITNR
jgi:very-short-patch-repair endonuclease